MGNNLDPIDIASTFVGTNNRAIFNDWFYGKKGMLTPYCGTFVSYCRFMGKMALGVVDYTLGFAGVPFAVKHYRDKGQLTKTPVRNDLCFFNWNGQIDPNPPELFEHTSLFKCDNNDGGVSFTSVEGNTSNPTHAATGGESNSGWVMEKRRLYSQAIFAHP